MKNSIIRVVLVSILGTVQFILVLGGVFYYGDGLPPDSMIRENLHIVALIAALLSMVWPAYVMICLKIPISKVAAVRSGLEKQAKNVDRG